MSVAVMYGVVGKCEWTEEITFCVCEVWALIGIIIEWNFFQLVIFPVESAF